MAFVAVSGIVAITEAVGGAVAKCDIARVHLKNTSLMLLPDGGFSSALYMDSVGKT